MAVWHGMDQATLDAALNNGAAVPGSAAIVAEWRRRSDRLRAARPQHLNLRYGPAERNRIDYFAARHGGPVLAFIHGGYWQHREKETFSFLAAGPLAHGIGVALIGYTLAPEQRLDGIVAEIRAAVGWLRSNIAAYGGDPERLFVSGWSAGGHLTAMALGEPGVAGGLAISGIYDLEPIRLSYLNEKLRLDEAEARRNSPLLDLPRSAPPLVLAYGGNELPELRRQSEEFAAARAAAGLPGRLAALPGHDHFSILEELADPAGALTALVREIIGS
jgi:acetyl esterase/lipase